VDMERLSDIQYFLVSFGLELFRRQGTILLNRTSETYLRCFTSEQLKAWAEFVPWAEY